MFAPLFNRLLKVKLIQRSHVAAYMVQYARDKGVTRLLWKIGRTALVQGPSVVFRTRGIVLNKLWIRKVAQEEFPASAVIPYDGDALRKRMALWTERPLVSIVVPVCNTPAGALVKMISSVTAQVYPNWELCMADDCSTQPGVREVLDAYAGDARIRVRYLEKNAGISAATNEAIKMTAGEYIGLLDHDDEITGDALFWIVDDLNRQGPFDIIYTDECKVDEAGTVESEVFHKPDWSPELLFSMMYTGHFSVYRKAFLEEKVGYFRSEYDFSQDYDLFLRASAMTQNIRHIQKVLYKWRKVSGSAARGDKGFARKSNVAALADTLRVRGIPGQALALPQGNRVRVHFDKRTLLSVIIPSDSYENLKAAIDSIIAHTAYPAYEIVVVAGSGIISAFRAGYPPAGQSVPPLIYVPYDEPYAFSGACNAGAAAAGGEMVIFFNDDLRPLDLRPLREDWLENLVEWLWVPGVGGVSPRILYGNGTIRYAGMVTGVRGLVGTAFHTYTTDTPAQFSFPKVHRNVSVLSGACLAMRRSLFLELGGFDAVHTPGAHSHTDLSFRIREHGQRLVFTAYSGLRQTDRSRKSRAAADRGKSGAGAAPGKGAGPGKGKKDKAGIYLIKRWAKYLEADPYFTRAMRDLLYLDSPEPFDFYAPAAASPLPGIPPLPGAVQPHREGDILLAAPDLAPGSANGILLDLGRILTGQGYFVVMTAEQDGALKGAFLESGIPVIVDALLLSRNASFQRFAAEFDMIVCHPAAGRPLVDQMQDSVPTLWGLPGGDVSLDPGAPELAEYIGKTFSIPTFADAHPREMEAVHE